MNLSPEAIDLSYAACRHVARRAGSSFYGSFFRLPRAKRRAMDALYAFMRHTDDLADNAQSADLACQALHKWRNALRHALAGQVEQIEDPSGRKLLLALADTAQSYRIPAEYLHAVVDGVQMDLRQNRYETFDELEGYCQRVASAVGLACIHVWGFRGRQALEPARKCGIALQLTNILRDLKEDAQRDRVYLPLEDLRQCHYSVEELKHAVADERFVRLMEFEIGRAEWFYREGAELIEWLETDGRRVFGMMMASYHALLRKIKRRPRAVLTRRVRLSKPKKLQIAARWTLLPPRVAALL